YFLGLPEVDRSKIVPSEVRSLQFLQPLFEFSGACTGCGETPYVKLLSQLFGDRAIIANATGCSSIYGGNLPSTPWSTNHDGRGPAWSNSLFENNAEFGLGIRLSLDKQAEAAGELVRALEPELGPEAVAALLSDQLDEAAVVDQRERVAWLKDRLAKIDRPEARRLLLLADALVRKSVWSVGGDGWAYDIGFGGLDHAIASGRDVNILVLDTEVYSNTGGQTSKATPRGAVAKFSAAGKPAGKKDLGLMAMTYGNVYVASVAVGARDEHTVRAFLEAERYRGPSIIIAYSHCIAHGIKIQEGLKQQKRAVDAGYWPLYRFNPDRRAQGLNPLQLDAAPPKGDLEDFMARENRFEALRSAEPGRAEELMSETEADLARRRRLYEYLAAMPLRTAPTPPAANGAASNGDAAKTSSIDGK
ncbi:MAG: pyruvate:ferredoxin (flavodoxin) oxidoreductase, partial [Elusimicrobia bacterium]|nr:pyruvate:ferredoxin (flavodoxin) oxidoreductase [Elusimicrobiota bacterium]